MNTLYFRPRWWTTVGVLLLCALFISLGNWQLRRADEKRALMELQQVRSIEAPIRLSTELRELGELRYRPVTVSGVYDVDHQFLLDNQIYEGRPGYHVLTPLRLQDGHVAVLINRGWVAVGADRRQLPALPAPSGKIELSGTLDRFFTVGLKLKGAEIPTPGWPATVQVVDSAKLAERLGYSVLPYQVLLVPAEPNGFQSVGRQMDLHPETSQGYALQWFSFAATAAALYLWYGFKRQPKQSPQSNNEQER